MESMAVVVNVSVVSGSQVLKSSRDNELNEKAFQRALMKIKSSSEQKYKQSEEISTEQMIHERKCRERILQMQYEINCVPLPSKLEIT